MNNSLDLILEQEYSVIKPFVDYEGIVHVVREIWIYEGTNFLPYEDGLGDYRDYDFVRYYLWSNFIIINHNDHKDLRSCIKKSFEHVD